MPASANVSQVTCVIVPPKCHERLTGAQRCVKMLVAQTNGQISHCPPYPAGLLSTSREPGGTVLPLQPTVSTTRHTGLGKTEVPTLSLSSVTSTEFVVMCYMRLCVSNVGLYALFSLFV